MLLYFAFLRGGNVIYRVVALILVSLWFPADAYAKSCGAEFYNGLISRANQLERANNRCDPVMKKFSRKKATPQQFCTACGPSAWHLVYLERYANDYASCLRQSAEGRKVLSMLRRYRKDFKFVQVACGL